MLQVQEWACSLCTRGWCSLTCGGTSTSVSRWLWRSLGFSPRQQWREHRPQSSVLWSRAWRARVEGTSGTYNSFYELLSCCFLLTNNMCNHTERSLKCNTVLMAIICPFVCLATVLLQGAQGPLLMTTWHKSCGRSAATCLASPGSELRQRNLTVKDVLL